MFRSLHSCGHFLQLHYDDIRYPDGIRGQGDFIDAVKLLGVPNQELVGPDLETGEWCSLEFDYTK